MQTDNYSFYAYKVDHTNFKFMLVAHQIGKSIIVYHWGLPNFEELLDLLKALNFNEETIGNVKANIAEQIFLPVGVQPVDSKQANLLNKYVI